MVFARSKLPEAGAGALVERVARLPQIRDLDRYLKQSGAAHVTGLRGSSPVFVIEALRRSLERRIVVCAPEEEEARDIVSDFGTVSTARVELFPEKEIFPQSFERRENLVVRGRRTACLDTILRDEIDVVVTSLRGFLAKTIPARVLSSGTRALRVGEHLDREGLLDFLIQTGYESVHVVDEIGQFAVRGSIVDIFDPSWESPVRLELLDDAVASIRAFDIDSQRSVGQKDSIRILPATGVVVNEESVAALDAYLRGVGVSTARIEDLKHEFEHQRFSYLLRRYGPVLGVTGTLLDYFAAPPVVVFWNEPGLANARTHLQAEFEKVLRSDGDYPLLALDRYIMPLDYYTAYDAPSVHLWPLPGEAELAAGGPSLPPAPASPAPAEGRVVTFHTAEHPAVMGKIETLVKLIRRLRNQGNDILIFSDGDRQRERFADMLEEDEELVHLPVGWITSGFLWEEAGFVILTDHEIFHRMLPRPSDRRKIRRARRDHPDDLQAGDFVVHVDYGIGRFIGLKKIAVGGGETECLSLRYQGNDRIFVPLDQMPLVEKYIGKEGIVPTLDRLGSAKWQRTKAKTKKALEEIARDMLRVYAEREVAEREPFGADTPWQKELEAAFPFEETPHQLRAAEEIKRDMESSRPMDRLICGDVGFGKTEVAIRAAFKAVNHGKQVAVLVPTTILALQHYKTFSERLAPFPVRVAMLSRFKTPAEQRLVVEGIRAGTVDVVIGTHRLLSKDVVYRNVGLLIVDEEHRFGVRSKEKIKRIKQSVDVLSMTATPIPRTLYMSLAGLRPISVIDTPPRNRHPIRTEVTAFDEGTIVQAISNEVSRGGQVYFLHNRVASIRSMQAFLEKLMPRVRFGVAHGQMTERDLEKTIVAFLNGEYDVLLSTTIIESGLDFPNVNTIVINRADRFGLADLYQLRGRVGRRERQAFAYLLVPRNFSVTERATRRLRAMEDFVELGSGYRLAMRDLEIRGAGNILGTQQHGQLVAVGFDLYCKMLKEAVEDLRGLQKPERPACRIETRLQSFLPERYVEDPDERMAIYRRLARMEDPREVDELDAELVDRFGAAPPEATNLTELTRLKLRATALGIALIQLKADRIVLEFLPGETFRPKLCAKLDETFHGRVLFKSASTFGLTVSLRAGDDSLNDARKLLSVAWAYATKDHSDIH
jgi:transcription-repair coupling factor (superfamily II helicase)